MGALSDLRGLSMDLQGRRVYGVVVWGKQKGNNKKQIGIHWAVGQKRAQVDICLTSKMPKIGYIVVVLPPQIIIHFAL